jgi:Ca2+-binding EF-hand superfamily protein
MAEYDVPGRTFAKVDGKISSEKLAWIMQNVAELDGEEVANIVKDAQADSTGGVIDYAAFGARFFAPVADP